MKSREPMDWLRTLPIAHRGLHDATRGIIENSPGAFEAAARAGYGIELDVHLSADGEAIVFHDRDLARVTRETGLVRSRTTSELTQILLEGSADTIPTLTDVFDLVRGRVPILVEIKNPRRKVGDLEGRVAELLVSYQGPVAVHSFNPYSLGWFAANAKSVLRGQISENFSKATDQPLPALQRFLLTHMLLNMVSRPHFIAYDCRALPAWSAARARLFGLPVLGWTVKAPDMHETIKPYTDNIIFENFKPPLGSSATVTPADND